MGEGPAKFSIDKGGKETFNAGGRENQNDPAARVPGHNDVPYEKVDTRRISAGAPKGFEDFLGAVAKPVPGHGAIPYEHDSDAVWKDAQEVIQQPPKKDDPWGSVRGSDVGRKRGSQ